MPNSKPYVSIACVCEHFLQEKDGVLSAIRIVDKFNVTMPPPEMLTKKAKGAVDVRAVVGVKAQGLAGAHDLRITLVYPSGERKELPPFPFTWKENEPYSGYNVALRLAIDVKEFGLYWFDVSFDSEALTRIPFQIIPAEPQAPPVTSLS